MKLISFTVPCYNSADYMHICLDSLLTGGDRVEIIIIDDGSTDSTGAIADAYAAKHPDIIRVIHQENGGHGEGINQGLKHATCPYFKVVDSDDWVNAVALQHVLNRLEQLEAEGGVDLMVCNYVYEHEDRSLLSTIRYKNVFPENQVIGWEETRSFRPDQYLTLHSAIYRTEIVRQSGIVLPKHIFYEDNLFVYAPLPLTKKLIYLNEDLYRYLIGREGQSVSEQVMMKRCGHQIEIAQRIFDFHDLDVISRESPKLGRYMYHEASFMLVIASAFTRLNRTNEAEEQVKAMWAHCYQSHPAMARKMRRNILNVGINLPGHLGRALGLKGYRLAHKIVQFN